MSDHPWDPRGGAVAVDHDEGWPAPGHDAGAAPGPVVEVHVEELVLHGFRPADRWTIGDAVEAELTRLLGASAGGFAPAEHARVDAGSFTAARGAGPAEIGQGVAGAVSRTIR